MKVIALNGSPRKDGNTYQALQVMTAELEKEGIETEIINVGGQSIHGCIGCRYCANSQSHLCVFKEDIVNAAAEKMRAADGFILSAPTYFAGIAGTMKGFLDRIFTTSSDYFSYKVGTSIAIARRAGAVDTVHQLNNYMNLAQMVLVPSQYWTIAYGTAQGEIHQDAEGIQTLRQNARAMAWLLKSLDAAKNIVPLPEAEHHVRTNFIR